MRRCSGVRGGITSGERPQGADYAHADRQVHDHSDDNGKHQKPRGRGADHHKRTTVKIVLTATSHKAATAIQMLRPFSEGTRYWPNSLIALSNPGLAASRS